MPNEKFLVADGEIVGSPSLSGTPNHLAHRRTLLAQQLLFRCGEFFEFSFVHFGIRQIE
jgi:hypothetical protein